MRKIIPVLLFIFILPHHLLSKILPKEGSKLNFRIIGFSFDGHANTDNYKLEIAAGSYYSEDSFRKNVIVTKSDRVNKMVAEVPAFGRPYTWRVVYMSGTKANAKGVFYHFSTDSIPDLDTSIIRFRIINPAVAYKDGYVLPDANKIIYDMKGRPVWFMPPTNHSVRDYTDVKVTPYGTITFLQNNRSACEINYSGDILWQTPRNSVVSGDSVEHYHHEFSRLKNGHYMILGSEAVYWDRRMPAVIDSNVLKQIHGKGRMDTARRKTNFGTVIEYDEKGNVVWSWKSSKYFMGSDVQYFMPKLGRNIVDVHENAFYFDEQNGFIYISFKNISRVLKVKYPEGKVVRSYGEVYQEGVPQKGNGLFCNQHCCRISQDGDLYLFNNNVCGDDNAMPSVVVMKEPVSSRDSLKKIWEYVCTAEGIENNPLARNRMEQMKRMKAQHPEMQDRKISVPHQTSGGSVTELPDHSFFISMNNEYSKLIIVNKDKEVLWSGVAEKWSKGENRWLIMLQYRASFISDRAQLEQLIWNGER